MDYLLPQIQAPDRAQQPNIHVLGKIEILWSAEIFLISAFKKSNNLQLLLKRYHTALQNGNVMLLKHCFIVWNFTGTAIKGLTSTESQLSNLISTFMTQLSGF